MDRPTNSVGGPAPLTFPEKKFLLAVERGDVASTRRMLEEQGSTINIDCVDPLGRTALLMGIDNENLEMVELLLENKVETKDALLHAINEEYVEAVEVLLDHEETIHKDGEPWVSLHMLLLLHLPCFLTCSFTCTSTCFCTFT